MLPIGKEYNLMVVKEIKVTDSFLGLDKDVINCQNRESLNECKTREYINTLNNQCGCLPSAISDKVIIYLYLFLLDNSARYNKEFTPILDTNISKFLKYVISLH